MPGASFEWESHRGGNALPPRRYSLLSAEGQTFLFVFRSCVLWGLAEDALTQIIVGNLDKLFLEKFEKS